MADTPTANGFLHRKLGPLTGMQWAVVAGATVGLYLLWRRRQAAAAAAAAGTSPGTGGPTLPSLGAPSASSAGVSPNSGPSGPATNQEWLQQAFNELVAHGVD